MMNKKNSPAKHFLRSAAIFVLLLAMTSCAKHNTSSSQISSKEIENTGNNLVIGFSIDTLALERWQRDLDVFMNTAKDLGAEVIVQNAGNSVEEQNRQLLYLADRKVNVIIVLPENADSLTDTINKIRSRNIPVISYDRLARNANISMYITVDSEEVGKLMAQGMLKRASGKKWFCILGPNEDYNTTLIQAGIQKTIRNTNIQIAHTFYTPGWNYDLSNQDMVNLLASGNIPDAIICGNDAVAESVIQALTTYYPDHHIPICGQDADIAACQNIVRGLQDFTIYKPITKLAETAAQCAVQLAKGKTPQDIIGKETINNGFADIPVMWLYPQSVDGTNIDEVVINSGFHTKGEVYREN
jgi:D-xylose transport system substrate-binding protein